MGKRITALDDLGAVEQHIAESELQLGLLVMRPERLSVLDSSYDALAQAVKIERSMLEFYRTRRRELLRP